LVQLEKLSWKCAERNTPKRFLAKYWGNINGKLAFSIEEGMERKRLKDPSEVIQKS